MADLLLELFSEEIPARMQAKAEADLRDALINGLGEAGVAHGEVTALSGPRRLAVAIDGLPEKSADVKEERKGPKVGAPDKAVEGFLRGAGLASIDEAEVHNDPKKGDFYVAVRNVPGRPLEEIIAELVPAIVRGFHWPKSMRWGPNTTSMGELRWVRPLQRVLCVFNGKTVPFEIDGLKSGNETEGHRVMGRGPFAVASLEEYCRVLEDEGHVALSRTDRRLLIEEQAHKVCLAAGLELVEDNGLLDEVTGLAEWPVVLLGDMDPDFLSLPPEVIQLSMRTHQKYFAVRDPKTGELAPNFVVVANVEASDGGKAIAAGNRKVLSARLDDARFFWDNDRNTPLEKMAEKLATIDFKKELGTIADKVERVAALARELAPKVGADPDLAERAARLAKADLVSGMVGEFPELQGVMGGYYALEAGKRAGVIPAVAERRAGTQGGQAESSDTGSRTSSDALSGMTGKGNANSPISPAQAGVSGNKEVPASAVLRQAQDEGGDWADGLDEADVRAIATAITEHYKPQGPSDAVPSEPVAIAVALADKLDTLVGFWAIDEKPTGSKDPFALRRAALGVVRIVLENGVRIGLQDASSKHGANVVTELQLRGDEAKKTQLDHTALIAEDDKNFAKRMQDALIGSESFKVFALKEGRRLAADLLVFFADRLKQVLRDSGTRHDLIDAVFALGEDDLVLIVNRVEALGAFLETDDGVNLQAGYKRAANILKAEEKKDGAAVSGEINPDAFEQDEERALHAAIGIAVAAADTALKDEDFAGAMAALAGLRQPVDEFFEAVTVNADDPALRQNRLLCLAAIRDALHRVADFSKIGG